MIETKLAVSLILKGILTGFILGLLVSYLWNRPKKNNHLDYPYTDCNKGDSTIPNDWDE